MDIESLIQRMIDDAENFVTYRTELRCKPHDIVSEYVEKLKSKVDENWSKDPQISLHNANLIIAIGFMCHKPQTLALGMMARGDTVKLLGRMQEAWDTLELAGELYKQAEDEVGWARTRIGRLFISPNLNRFDQALAEADTAREIFFRCQEFERLLRLDLNTGYLFHERGSYQDALDLYFRALEAALLLGKKGAVYLGTLYMNMGGAHLDLGHFPQSEKYLKAAFKTHLDNNETYELINSQFNLAELARLQGHYREALKLLLSLENIKADGIPVQYIHIRRVLCGIYLVLNRHAEANELARRSIDICRKLTDVKQELGYILRYLAIAQAEGGHFEDAQKTLDEAEAIFTFVGAKSWVSDVWLRRSQIAFKQNDYERAISEARRAAVYFNDNKQILSYAEACLVEGQAAFANGDDSSALEVGQQALKSAQKARASWLRYSGHVLLGQIAERQNRTPRAIWRYRAAVATLERSQRDLTITLRPEFLQDKLEGLRGLMRLYLASGENEQAFNTLESTKSQVLMQYLANQEHLHWRKNDGRSEALITELKQLRAEHHAHYEIAFKMSDSVQRTPEQQERSTQAVATCEARMRAITEQLYLYSDNNLQSATAPLKLDVIFAQLPTGTLTLEFYNDSKQMWVFVVDQHGLAVYPLPMSVRELNEHIKRFQRKITSALIACGKMGAASEEANSLTQGIQRELSALYQGILQPVEHHFQAASRIVIVPYGELHYLPFHLLFDGSGYLIQSHEVVVLPASGLMSLNAPQRSGGARILANSWQGELPQTLNEARMVQAILGGETHCEDAARREVLNAAPTKVLHIAAHGEYRIDHPDLSFIQLADGQLYTDDLLQQDMSYELVTLSACETGRSKVSPGDELIGLGRGFLYAGTGALITSLWRVEDSITVRLMEQLYRALRKGASKAAALREAQLYLLRNAPHLHPAFWGAFQLVGNPEPLSST